MDVNVFAGIDGANPAAKPPDTPQAGDAPEAPPPYSTLPGSATDMGPSPWTSPGPAAGALGVSGYVPPRGIKLAYMDFVPRLLKKKTFGSNVYEEFSGLVSRGNAWLEEHDGLCVISCETITWTGNHFENIYADGCYAILGTRHVRGLRIWYVSDVIPSPHHQRAPQVVTCRTFMPKAEEKFHALLSRVNDSLTGEDKIGGRILSVETIPQHTLTTAYHPGTVNPNACRWTRENTEMTVVLSLRVFAVVTTEQAVETIGYQDFTPEHNQRHRENKGYEVYSELMDKASRWIARQQGVRFSNLQTVTLKIKKKIPFEERCAFLDKQEASYLSVVRAFFTIPLARGGATSRLEFAPFRLTYRTFTPGQLAIATTNNPVKYEDTRQICDKINQWLQLTGAQIFSIETVPIKMSSGMLGSEATYFKNNPGRERVLYHIRVYFNGDYIEPPGAVGLVVPGNARMTLQGDPGHFYPGPS